MRSSWRGLSGNSKTCQAQGDHAGRQPESIQGDLEGTQGACIRWAESSKADEGTPCRAPLFLTAQDTECDLHDCPPCLPRETGAPMQCPIPVCQWQMNQKCPLGWSAFLTRGSGSLHVCSASGFLAYNLSHVEYIICSASGFGKGPQFGLFMLLVHKSAVLKCFHFHYLISSTYKINKKMRLYLYPL